MARFRIFWGNVSAAEEEEEEALNVGGGEWVELDYATKGAVRRTKRKKPKVPKRKPLPKIPRPALPEPVVEQVAQIAASEPTFEQLEVLARAVIPEGGEQAVADMSFSVMAELQSQINRAAQAEIAARHQAREQAERELAEHRRQVIMEQVARYLDILEQDELLLAYII